MWGRARLSGQVLWATALEETVATSEASSGGKGGDSGAEITEYSYFANFAVGLCEGEISHIGGYGPMARNSTRARSPGASTPAPRRKAPTA